MKIDEKIYFIKNLFECKDINDIIFDEYYKEYYFDQITRLKRILPKYRDGNDINLFKKFDDIEYYDTQKESKIVGDNSKIIFNINTGLGLLTKNFKLLTNNFENIDYITLVCGGQIIETIYPETINILKKLYNIDDNSVLPFYTLTDNCFPFYAANYHILEINVYFKDVSKSDNISLTYERYKMLNYDEYINIFKYYFEKIFFTTNKVSITSSKKWIHHKVHYIISNKIINSVDLGFVKFKPLLVDIVDNLYLYALTKSLNYDDFCKFGINFGNVKEIIFNIDNNEEATVYLVNYNHLKTMSGMIGLSFAT